MRPRIPFIEKLPVPRILHSRQIRRSGVRALMHVRSVPPLRPVADLGMRVLFDSMATSWEKIRDVETYIEGMKQGIALLPRSFRPKRVLDAACGTGLATRAVRERWKSARIHGIDLSQAMIEQARELMPDAEFLTASVRDMPFADGEFDLVVALDGVIDIDEFLRVTHRLGRIVIVYSQHGTTPVSIPLEKLAARFAERGALAAAHTTEDANVLIVRHSK